MRLTRFQMLMGGTLVAAVGIGFGTVGAARWVLWTLLCTCSGLGVGLGVAFPQWQMFGRSLCRVASSGKRVALTFDDGPDPETTPGLLALLARRGIRATFFCIGERVVRAPELARRIIAAGHAVENHSHAHLPWTNLLSEAALRADLLEAQHQIQAATGRAPRFFRPPMGLTNQRVFRVAGELGLELAGYAARGRDRKPQPPERIVARLLRGLRPGNILLLHDGGVSAPQLVAVVSLLLDRLESLGYECVRLDELADGTKARIDQGRFST